MIRCLNRLYSSDERHVAEYPMSVRTPDSEDYCFELVYRDLASGILDWNPGARSVPGAVCGLRVRVEAMCRTRSQGWYRLGNYMTGTICLCMEERHLSEWNA